MFRRLVLAIAGVALGDDAGDALTYEVKVGCQQWNVCYLIPKGGEDASSCRADIESKGCPAELVITSTAEQAWCLESTVKRRVSPDWPYTQYGCVQDVAVGERVTRCAYDGSVTTEHITTLRVANPYTGSGKVVAQFGGVPEGGACLASVYGTSADQLDCDVLLEEAELLELDATTSKDGDYVNVVISGAEDVNVTKSTPLLRLVVRGCDFSKAELISLKAIETTDCSRVVAQTDGDVAALANYTDAKCSVYCDGLTRRGLLVTEDLVFRAACARSAD